MRALPSTNAITKRCGPSPPSSQVSRLVGALREISRLGRCWSLGLVGLLVGRFGGDGGDVGVDVLLEDVFDAASEQWVGARVGGVAPIVAGELEELPAFGLEQLGGPSVVAPAFAVAE